jgi:hypothetical protein
MDNIEKIGLLKVVQTLNLENRSVNNDTVNERESTNIENNQLYELSTISKQLFDLNSIIGKLVGTRPMRNVTPQNSISKSNTINISNNSDIDKSLLNIKNIENNQLGNLELIEKYVRDVKIIAKNISKILSRSFGFNVPNTSTPSTNTNNNSKSTNTNNNNFALPSMADFTKGLSLGFLPKGVIKMYVGGIQRLVDELSQVKTKDVDVALAPLYKLGESLSNFANISLVGSLASLAKLKVFVKGLRILFKDMGSDKNLQELSGIKNVADAIAKPLESIGNSLIKFGDIKWTKILIASKILKNFITSFSKIPAATAEKTSQIISSIANKLKSPLEILGNSLEKFGNKLGTVTGNLMKGALAVLALSSSIIPLAIGLKMFNGIKWENVAKAGVAIGGLIGLSALLSKTSGATLKGVGIIAALGASLLPLALSLKMVSGVKWSAFGILATTLTTLGLAAAGLGIPAVAPFVIAGAGVIALLGASIIPLAFGLKMLNDVDSKNLLNIIPGLLGLTAAGVALMLGAPGLLLGGLALIPFAGAIAVLKMAMQGLDAENLKALPDFFSKIAEVSWTLAKSAPALIASGLAITPLAASVKLLSIAIGNSQSMVDFFTKFGEFTEKINPQKLFDAAKGILSLSASIAAFGAAQATEGLGNLVGKLLRFGSDSPLEQFQKFAEIATPLDIASKAIATLADGINKLNEIQGEIKVLADFPFDELEDLASEIKGKAIIQIITNGGLGPESKISGQNQVANTKIVSEEQAKAAGYNSLEEYKQKTQLMPELTPVPNQIGSTLSSVGPATATNTVVVNNNTGGNVSNVSTSNVNNSASAPAPIITGSAMALF